MSKSMLVTFPFVLLLLDFWPLERIRLTGKEPFSGNPNLKWLLIEKIPLFAFSFAAGILAILGQKAGGALGSFEELPLSVRMATAVVSYMKYIKQMFVPAGLCVMYPHPGMPSMADIVPALVFLFLITGICIYFIRKKYPLFGWLWYVGTMLPVIGIIQVGVQARADRYAYIPLIGLFIILSWTLRDMVYRFRIPKKRVQTFAVMIICILSIVTWFQIGWWENSYKLFSRAVSVTENNYIAHNNLGIVLAEKGRLDRAIYHFKKALEINPNHESARFNLQRAIKEKKRKNASSN
jgi:hypothetical protein